MAETFGFYDAEELIDGSYDREYVAQQWADYFKLFIGTGVFASPTNQLKVVAGEGMNIVVKEGWAFIEGRWYHNDSDLVLAVQPNTTASTITSGVFIQADSSDRVIKAVVATGRTTPDRESPLYELELAQIQLATGTTAITNAMITDMRTDESVCGFVKGLLEGVIPTADLFLQFQTQFNTWFEQIRGQLDEDAAGHLQNEIDDLNENVTSINDNLTSEGGVPFKFGIDSNGDYGYYKQGESNLTPFKSRHTETYKPAVRANNLDMGLYHKKRYVDTTDIPNANSGTYTVTSNGRKDMGETNTNRFVEVNVPSVERVYTGYGTSCNFGYTTDPNRVWVAYCSTGGGFSVSATGVDFGGQYRAYVVIIFTTNAVHKVINGSITLGVRSSGTVNLGGTYDTTKMGVSLSMNQFQVTALSGTAVTIYNADNGYRLSTSYSIAIFK